jgi:hypothetical protein
VARLHHSRAHTGWAASCGDAPANGSPRAAAVGPANATAHADGPDLLYGARRAGDARPRRRDAGLGAGYQQRRSRCHRQSGQSLRAGEILPDEDAYMALALNNAQGERAAIIEACRREASCRSRGKL